MATPNPAIPHILQSQAQKEVIANAAFDALDQATAGLLEMDVLAGGTITVHPAGAPGCKMLRLTALRGKIVAAKCSKVRNCLARNIDQQ